MITLKNHRIINNEVHSLDSLTMVPQIHEAITPLKIRKEN